MYQVRQSKCNAVNKVFVRWEYGVNFQKCVLSLHFVFWNEHYNNVDVCLNCLKENGALIFPDFNDCSKIFVYCNKCKRLAKLIIRSFHLLTYIHWWNNVSCENIVCILWKHWQFRKCGMLIFNKKLFFFHCHFSGD